MVMGRTGSGKTTFINIISGADLETEASLEQCTQQIQSVSCHDPDAQSHSVTLYDIPDIDGLPQIEDALASLTHRRNETRSRPYAAIIFVLDISRPRDNIRRDRNYVFLEDLRRRGRLRRLLFLVTNWPEDDEEHRDPSAPTESEQNVVGPQRRWHDYKTDYLKDLIEAGATVHRFNRRADDIHQIFRKLLRTQEMNQSQACGGIHNAVTRSPTRMTIRPKISKYRELG
ncbi:uncharacterized protein C8Q71DRAFT_791578 [Rhodofomes roseus]|uniref:G domain-containing protein n=1 Tax=Rhodofomes roseus TaxID=34475 RepID=A0ABQ8JY56_9APHY|nr:uncharacterized protein C8Q71DRAFT_791578 [Rhodofomes roseus]KAH9829194.1 hypothetical protein C8Q71DRAFT_791578 [Rhodofomes roseus]